jgi:hypothetical protein
LFLLQIKQIDIVWCFFLNIYIKCCRFDLFKKNRTIVPPGPAGSSVFSSFGSVRPFFAGSSASRFSGLIGPDTCRFTVQPIQPAGPVLTILVKIHPLPLPKYLTCATTQILLTWLIYMKISFPTPCLFSLPKNPILSSKTSVNENWIFKNFGFHLPKFPDIEKYVFSTIYFSLGEI